MSICHTIALHSDYGLTLALFAGGLAGSISHCTGMCGPFVLAQVSALKPQNTASPLRFVRPMLLPYHAGRATTYIFLGGLVSFLSIHILKTAIVSTLSHLLLILAGTLFLASAFSSSMPSWLPSFCKMPLWIKEQLSKLFLSHSMLGGYITGILLGFLPCGLVYAALLGAAASETPLQAMLGMAAFTVGTMPALITIGLGGHWLLSKYQPWMKAASALLMVFNGVTLFILAGKGIA
jgi:sulfite exporter TauE/SafE